MWLVEGGCARHQRHLVGAINSVFGLKTVRNHVSHILVKLQVADRAQAVIRARDAGIGQDRV